MGIREGGYTSENSALDKIIIVSKLVRIIYEILIMCWQDKSETVVIVDDSLDREEGGGGDAGCLLHSNTVTGAAQKGWRAEEQGSAGHVRGVAPAQGAQRDTCLSHLISSSPHHHCNNLSLFRVPRNRSEITVPQITD